MVAMIWGSTFIVIKDSVDGYSPFALIAGRFIIATVLIGAVVIHQKLNPFKYLLIGIIGGIAQFMTFAPQAVGLQTTSPSNSAFITGLFVVFTPILSFVFVKIKPKPIEVLASIIAITGLWILTGGVQNFSTGDFITILTAIAISACLIITKKALDLGVHPLVITFQQLLVTAVISLFIAVVTNAPLIPSNPNVFLSMLYLGVMATFLAFFIQNSVMKSLDSSLVSIVISTEPFFALLFSWAFSFEGFDVVKLIGGLIMLFAIILPELKFRRNILYGASR